jgi:hypothetical protein
MKKKILAVIFSGLMCVSIFAFFVGSMGNAGRGGLHQDINSVGDVLRISPQGVHSVRYIDVQKIQGTPLGTAVSNAIPPYSQYNPKITKACVVVFEDGTWVEFHQTGTNPNFDYVDVVDYNGHEILKRYVGNGWVYNVLGTPNIYGPIENVKKCSMSQMVM